MTTTNPILPKDPIIGYTVLTDVTELQAKLEQYTCPNDGYVHAWLDAYDPLLVWHVDTCPVDAIVAMLKTELTLFVDYAYKQQKDANPYQRIRKIIDAVREDAVIYLRQNADVPEDIANYLSETTRLQKWIIDEMKAQGVMT